MSLPQFFQSTRLGFNDIIVDFADFTGNIYLEYHWFVTDHRRKTSMWLIDKQIDTETTVARLL